MHDFVGVGEEIGDGGAGDGMPEVDDDEGPTICRGQLVCLSSRRARKAYMLGACHFTGGPSRGLRIWEEGTKVRACLYLNDSEDLVDYTFLDRVGVNLKI